MTQITNPKLLTLCIATFNRSERVTQLINEILNFDIDDLIEILVIDDGSSDDTYESISRFSSYKNVSVYRNEKNLGWAQTIMKYFQLCTTEFLLEVPDDDMIYKDGLLELLAFLSENNPDFICTRWIDVNRELYPGRGNDKVQVIPISKIKAKAGHSPGCVYRTTLMRNAEKIILEKIEKRSTVIDVFPIIIMLILAKLSGAKLLDSPIVIGGYREEGPLQSNLLDLEGNHYLSLPSAFAQHIFLLEFYQELLVEFKDSKFSKELLSIIEVHNNSFYNIIDDAVSLYSFDLAQNFRIGSSRNFINPLRAIKYFYKFILFKIQVIFFNR